MSESGRNTSRGGGAAQQNPPPPANGGGGGQRGGPAPSWHNQPQPRGKVFKGIVSGLVGK